MQPGLALNSPGYNAGNGLQFNSVAPGAPNYVEFGQPQSQAQPSAVSPSGASPVNSNPYASLVPQAQQQVGQLNNLYNQLFGQIGNYEQAARGRLEGSAQNTQQGLTNQFEQQSRQLPWAFAARGTGDSSFAYDAQKAAGDNYNTANQATQSQLQDQEAQLAGYVGQQKGTYQGQQNYWNGLDLNQAASPYLMSSLGSTIAETQGALGGLQGSDFMKTLNQYGTSPLYNPTQLQKQYSDLLASSAPKFAKDQIASGLAQSYAPDNASYWLNYYNNLTPQA